MKEKGYDKVDISKDRFLELSINPETGYFEEKSIIETKGGLEAELKGMFKNLRRPENPKNKLDFQTKLPDGTTIFVDHKAMVDFNRLAEEKGIEVGRFRSHETVAFNIGKDSVEQKGKHIPKDSEGNPIYVPQKANYKSCSEHMTETYLEIDNINPRIPWQKMYRKTEAVHRKCYSDRKYVPLKTRTKTMADLKKDDTSKRREVTADYLQKYELKRKSIQDKRIKNN